MVQDIVLNHLGSYHHLFRDQPAADWFHASHLHAQQLQRLRPQRPVRLQGRPQAGKRRLVRHHHARHEPEQPARWLRT
ncbi:MAG: hypothetical protein WKG07_12170 [Hymenobacter sp.]